MTTPTRPYSSVAFQSFVSSGSFLQQLLEEINGPGTSTVLHNRTTSQAHGSRQASAGRVSGTAITQDCCEKLRAADEVRMQETSNSRTTSTPDVLKRTLHLHAQCFDSPSSSSTGSSSRDTFLPSPMRDSITTCDTCSVVSSAAGSNRFRPTVGGLRLLASMTHDMQSSTPDYSARSNSSLFFYNLDFDTSSTPSPTDPPTSATSTAPTDATIVLDDRPSTPSASGSHSPRKRALSHSESSDILSKKVRTDPPIARSRPVPQFMPHTSSPGDIGGDNRHVIQSSTFTQRTPAPFDLVSSITTGMYSKLPSFRPQVAGPRGVPFVSATPMRPSTSESPKIERNESPVLADSPIYARSLHLVDTNVSIFKKTHGDEWRENSLCLYCFRQHGDFNRLNKHGYEVCGCNEALESHYWESNEDSEQE